MSVIEKEINCCCLSENIFVFAEPFFEMKKKKKETFHIINFD